MLVLALTLLSAAPALAEDLKVAYVDMARALNEVEEGKAAKDRLQGEFKLKQKKLDELQTQLKAKQAEFEKRKAMMKEDVRQAKMEEMQRDFLELQQTYATLQKELLEEERKQTEQIASRITTVVSKIGDRDGYQMILNIGESVLYYKRHQEITDLVVRMYNEQFPKKK
jgi:outer membrane protein